MKLVSKCSKAHTFYDHFKWFYASSAAEKNYFQYAIFFCFFLQRQIVWRNKRHCFTELLTSGNGGEKVTSAKPILVVKLSEVKGGLDTNPRLLKTFK